MKKDINKNELFEAFELSKEERLKGLRLPTIRRYPKYLRVLWDLAALGREVVSSEKIANELNLDPIMVRKDLAFTGVIGKPKIGFSIIELIKGIEKLIKHNDKTNVIIIGAGSLGSALLGYKGFEQHGFNIIAAFDNDPVKIGSIIHNKPVLPLEDIYKIALLTDDDIGVLCVPEHVAQQTTDILIKAGIKAIWNFTHCELKVPEYLTVLNEDLASSLVVLAVNMQRNNLKTKF
ncbi:MAG TPA: redox-sensing transcriptional repressor Rex [Melioribacteraceae bacterium]|nr:redox-sensing transcriptional repressor Rex [Melioribacteraceae bacterium]